jgi:hypothetical protein
MRRDAGQSKIPRGDWLLGRTGEEGFSNGCCVSHQHHHPAGSYEAFLETSRQAKAILEGLGAKNFRVLGTLVAGEATSSFATIWEADDYASYGAVMDKFLGNADAMKLLMEANSADGPTASFQGSLWSDIDL